MGLGCPLGLAGVRSFAGAGFAAGNGPSSCVFAVDEADGGGFATPEAGIWLGIAA